MKTFTRNFFWGVMLLVSQVVVADAELDEAKAMISKEAYVDVTTAPIVREQINKLPLADKKRAEVAVKVGAAYMKVYLHGLASCDASDLWPAYMGGLTETDNGWDWYHNYCGGTSGYSDQHIEPLACSPVALVVFQFKDGGVMLEYRITRMGGFIRDKYSLTEFRSEGAGDTRLFRVAINANNRIYDIAPRGDPAEIGYVEMIEEARTLLNGRGYLGAPSLAELEGRKMRLREITRQIEQQAAKVCKQA